MLKAGMLLASTRLTEGLLSFGKAIASKSSAMNLKTWMLGAVLYFALVAPSVGWADTLYYIHSDNLNTPKVMTNQARQVVWKGQYEPFGKVTETVNAVENNLRFPGQYHDRETGLYYNYFRDYDPAIGRYVQADPLGLDAGLNIFSYVSNNPIQKSDKLGLAEDMWCVVKCASKCYTFQQMLCVIAYSLCMGPDTKTNPRVPTRPTQGEGGTECVREYERCSAPFEECKKNCITSESTTTTSQ
jgi:RHS repeat-associated protein